MTISMGHTPNYPEGWFIIHFGVKPDQQAQTVDQIVGDLAHQFGIREAYLPTGNIVEMVFTDGDSWESWGETRTPDAPLHLQVATPYLSRAVDIEAWILTTYGSRGERWLLLDSTLPVFTIITMAEDYSVNLEHLVNPMRVRRADGRR